MGKQSILEDAFNIVLSEKNGVKFSELWNKVCLSQGFDENSKKNQLAKFYTLLSLDGRFVAFPGNIWNLKERYKYDEIRADVNDLYDDLENDVDDLDDEETKEYNKLLEPEKKKSEDDDLPIVSDNEDI